MNNEPNEPHRATVAQAVQAEMEAVQAAIINNRPWFITLSVVLIVIGMISLAAPFATTIIVKVFLGWMFLIAGLTQLAHAFYTRGWEAFLGNIFMGLLYAFVGGWLAFFPLTGIITLTVLLAIMFIVEGGFKFMMGMQIRPADGWFWIIISGFISLLLGAMIFTGLPSTAAWAIGLLVGLNILFSGISFLMLTLSTKAKSS